MLEDTELTEDCTLCFDDEGLPESFLESYMEGIPYRSVSLKEHETEELLKRQIGSMVKDGELVLLLVSPYYAELLTDGLSEEQRDLVIRPNPANLYCGMGICGSCSHTDSEGVTVKLCKCSRAVIE